MFNIYQRVSAFFVLFTFFFFFLPLLCGKSSRPIETENVDVGERLAAPSQD